MVLPGLSSLRQSTGSRIERNNALKGLYSPCVRIRKKVECDIRVFGTGFPTDGKHSSLIANKDQAATIGNTQKSERWRD